MSQPTDCEACDSTGEVECQYCGSYVECEECGGTGAIEGEE